MDPVRSTIQVVQAATFHSRGGDRHQLREKQAGVAGAAGGSRVLERSKGNTFSRYACKKHTCGHGRNTGRDPEIDGDRVIGDQKMEESHHQARTACKESLWQRDKKLRGRKRVYRCQSDMLSFLTYCSNLRKDVRENNRVNGLLLRSIFRAVLVGVNRRWDLALANVGGREVGTGCCGGSRGGELV